MTNSTTSADVNASQEQELKPKKRAEKKAEQSLVAIDPQGHLNFTNQVQLKNAAEIMIKMKMAPEHLSKEGFHVVAAAMVLCKQYNVPQKCMNEMAWIKGKITPYGTVFSGLAERHKYFGEKEEFYIDENQDQICVKNKNLKNPVWAHVIRIKKKGATKWNEYVFSMDDARTAGLLNPTKRDGSKNLDSPWIKYIKDMLMHKNKTRAYKQNYASAVEGLDCYEDIVDSVDQLRDVSTHEQVDVQLENADDINQVFSDESSEVVIEENAVQG